MHDLIGKIRLSTLAAISQRHLKHTTGMNPSVSLCGLFFACHRNLCLRYRLIPHLLFRNQIFMKLLQDHQFLCAAHILIKRSLPHLVDHGMLCRTDQVDRCNPELLIIGSVKIHIQRTSGAGLSHMLKHGTLYSSH